MTTGLTVEHDPYALDMPHPDSAVVPPRWITPGNTHPNSRYRDPVWFLGPMVDNPGIHLPKIHWANCPEPLRDQVKLSAWTMINGELRPTYLQTRGAAARGRASAMVMQYTCGEWMRLARWLAKRGLTSLAACTEDEWRGYASERMTEVVSRSAAEIIYGRLTRLWAYDELSPRPAGIAQPPWQVEGVDDFLPAEDSTPAGENAREPLDPEVLGPLLVWAIRFVDEFADDIQAAWAENRRLTALAHAAKATDEARIALEEFLLPMARTGTPLPSVRLHGRTRLSHIYVAALTGASLTQTDGFSSRHGLRPLAAQRPGPCPMEVPVSGKIDGKSWRERMDFGEAAELMRHLGTAAVIVILYLSGMRPQEVQGLRSGCCPDPEPGADGVPGRHLIRSHHFKGVTDDDGHHVSAGEVREVPWVAITPVVHAIRVLERMVPEGELLLSASHHDFVRRIAYHGALKNTALNERVEDFVAWVNRETKAQGRPDHIPSDPHGSIGLSRFRRTLAWHIARRPGGLIALAIQYGHLRTVLDARTSSGYANRSRRGIHGILDVETALAAADTAARLRDSVAAGETLSGPAARRALTAAAQVPRFAGRIVSNTFARKAAAFLARDGVVLFDNPDAFLICAFKREIALCEPDPDANAPRQYDCRPGCGNAVRTDTHARLLRERAAEIYQLAAHAPQPVGKRMRANADRLYETADTHDATAQPAEAWT